MKELTEDMYQGTVGFINNIMDDGRLFYLYNRWQDEKEYEEEINVEDYLSDDDIPDYKLKSNNYSADDDDKDIPFAAGTSFTQYLTNQLNTLSNIYGFLMT